MFLFYFIFSIFLTVLRIEVVAWDWRWGDKGGEGEGGCGGGIEGGNGVLSVVLICFSDLVMICCSRLLFLFDLLF